MKSNPIKFFTRFFVTAEEVQPLWRGVAPHEGEGMGP